MHQGYKSVYQKMFQPLRSKQFSIFPVGVMPDTDTKKKRNTNKTHLCKFNSFLAKI